jgi:hypothetical protein
LLPSITAFVLHPAPHLLRWLVVAVVVLALALLLVLVLVLVLVSNRTEHQGEALLPHRFADA